ncbi:hypothetical protein HAX54_028521 [Datura stramonium]|uniref:Uncharacterized protein n=1 Tax=Datura stramonium TaxID=4076 RepID=A0ABS8V6D1_DATST|nr:hypothetical protein [Datura stramonium]
MDRSIQIQNCHKLVVIDGDVDFILVRAQGLSVTKKNRGRYDRGEVWQVKGFERERIEDKRIEAAFMSTVEGEDEAVAVRPVLGRGGVSPEKVEQGQGKEEKGSAALIVGESRKNEKSAPLALAVLLLESLDEDSADESEIYYPLVWAMGLSEN